MIMHLFTIIQISTIQIRSSMVKHTDTSMNGAVTLVQLATVAYELQAINIFREAKFIFMCLDLQALHIYNPQ